MAEGQKCDINLTLRAQDCNATVEPQVSYSTSHLLNLIATGNNKFTVLLHIIMQ